MDSKKLIPFGGSNLCYCVCQWNSKSEWLCGTLFREGVWLFFYLSKMKKMVTPYDTVEGGKNNISKNEDDQIEKATQYMSIHGLYVYICLCMAFWEMVFLREPALQKTSQRRSTGCVKSCIWSKAWGREASPCCGKAEVRAQWACAHQLWPVGTHVTWPRHAASLWLGTWQGAEGYREEEKL